MSSVGGSGAVATGGVTGGSGGVEVVTTRPGARRGALPATARTPPGRSTAATEHGRGGRASRWQGRWWGDLTGSRSTRRSRLRHDRPDSSCAHGDAGSNAGLRRAFGASHGTPASTAGVLSPGSARSRGTPGHLPSVRRRGRPRRVSCLGAMDPALAGIRARLARERAERRAPSPPGAAVADRRRTGPRAGFGDHRNRAPDRVAAAPDPGDAGHRRSACPYPHDAFPRHCAAARSSERSRRSRPGREAAPRRTPPPNARSRRPP